MTSYVAAVMVTLSAPICREGGLGTPAGGGLVNRIDPALWKRGVAGVLIVAAPIDLPRVRMTSA